MLQIAFVDALDIYLIGCFAFVFLALIGNTMESNKYILSVIFVFSRICVDEFPHRMPDQKHCQRETQDEEDREDKMDGQVNSCNYLFTEPPGPLQ